MNTSTLRQLQDPTVIVLAAGHGGTDPGATNGAHKERDQAIVIVDKMAALLRARLGDDAVVIDPHDHDTHESIPWVNNRFGFGDAWVLEIHRDSADGLNAEDASTRLGVYHGPSESSREVGQFLRERFVRAGSHANSWARPDTASRFGSLGWIRQTRPAAHLLEMAFMEGRNTPEHLDWLATVAAGAVFEAFTGQNL